MEERWIHCTGSSWGPDGRAYFAINAGRLVLGSFCNRGKRGEGELRLLWRTTRPEGTLTELMEWGGSQITLTVEGEERLAAEAALLG